MDSNILSFDVFILVDFGYKAVTLVAQLLLGLLILEKIWPAIQFIRYVLMPYFIPSEQTLKMRYGNWAVITGATDGIGKAYAFELAKRNINVILISRCEEKLLKTAIEIEEKYPVKTKIITADFSKSSEEFYKKLADQLSEYSVGILVNNVGINYEYPMRVHELNEQQVLSIININLVSTTMMTRIILPSMVKNKKGAIVNVSSGAELQPWPLMALYASTKAYIKNFSDALRFEYNTKGITIQTLSPFFTNTKINDFSQSLRETTLIVPSPETYARHATLTLGKLDHTTGYWPHGFQYFFSSLAPYSVRMFIAGYMNTMFREEYFRKHNMQEKVE